MFTDLKIELGKLLPFNSTIVELKFEILGEHTCIGRVKEITDTNVYVWVRNSEIKKSDGIAVRVPLADITTIDTMLVRSWVLFSKRDFTPMAILECLIAAMEDEYDEL